MATAAAAAWSCYVRPRSWLGSGCATGGCWLARTRRRCGSCVVLCLSGPPCTRTRPRPRPYIYIIRREAHDTRIGGTRTRGDTPGGGGGSAYLDTVPNTETPLLLVGLEDQPNTETPSCGTLSESDRNRTST
jgi:hypothetical protein